jgi:hypothetical protein
MFDHQKAERVKRKSALTRVSDLTVGWACGQAEEHIHLLVEAGSVPLTIIR